MRRKRLANKRFLQSGGARLLAALALLCALWMFVLPAIGKSPGVRASIDRNNARGIDGSAKFYSEHPGLSSLLEPVTDARRRNDAAFW